MSNTRKEYINQIDLFETSECRLPGIDSNIFFPEVKKLGKTEYDIVVAKAKAICQRCVIREECLENALSENDQNGISGGKTENERRILKRERNQQKIKNAFTSSDR